MAKRGVRIEQIIQHLRDVEIFTNEGSTISQACRKAGISDQTYYRWRKTYGGLRLDQVKRLKELEIENTRLKKLVADLSLDNSILKETVSGNF